MARPRYFSKTGKPLTMLEFAKKFENNKYRQVAHTEYGTKGRFVSTIWLGLDHSFGPRSKPLIFETAIVTSKGADVIRRYETLKEAKKGHNEIVSSVQKGKRLK